MLSSLNQPREGCCSCSGPAVTATAAVGEPNARRCNPSHCNILQWTVYCLFSICDFLQRLLPVWINWAYASNLEVGNWYFQHLICVTQCFTLWYYFWESLKFTYQQCRQYALGCTVSIYQILFQKSCIRVTLGPLVCV